ncbi:MAG TPA: hypothetical protein PLQ09_01340 [Prolixibacteraceae bacterium]|nr:hypothetical protein [Prolixibacteraceae bacterium]
MKKEASSFKYLSLRKTNRNVQFLTGELVLLLYRKSSNIAPGIIGFCKVAGDVLITREIPKENRKYCNNRSLKQLPVSDIQCYGGQNLIDEEMLYALPQMNRYGKYRVFAECSLISIPGSVISVLNDYSRLWHIWRKSSSQENISAFKRLFLHMQNEKTEFKKYFSLIRGVNRCAICGIEHKAFEKYNLPFFELHDSIVHAYGKYEKPNYQKYIPLCANCHIKEHEKKFIEEAANSIINQCDSSSARLLTGWDVEYFRENLK